MKHFLIMILTAGLIIGFVLINEALAADDAYTLFVHVQDGSYLNGRMKPSKDSAIEIRLFRGDAVSVITIENGWAEIIGGEAGTAWCCVDYLADYPPDGDVRLYTVVANGRVRVRRTPDGDVVGYVQNGDTVEVRFVIDGWAYIGNGYVMADYLEEAPCSI